jgi:hypothetical protein
MLKTAKIITANTWFECDFMTFRRTRVAKALFKRGLQDMGPAEDVKPLKAFVNAGRWSITCPDCNGGEFAWEEGWVMCLSCFNEKIGHRIRKVEFPTTRPKIEALLLRRPLSARNWQVGETLKFLEEENQAHKAELLPAVAAGGGN